jgi:hypothetical protein
VPENSWPAASCCLAGVVVVVVYVCVCSLGCVQAGPCECAYVCVRESASPSCSVRCWLLAVSGCFLLSYVLILVLIDTQNQHQCVPVYLSLSTQEKNKKLKISYNYNYNFTEHTWMWFSQKRAIAFLFCLCSAASASSPNSSLNPFVRMNSPHNICLCFFLTPFFHRVSLECGHSY